MGRRYFCDYCDRSFQDNLHNRKKHLNGVQHQKCKKVWYDLFRDAAEILAEEECKKLCRRFLQTGQCDFGPSCRFSHMSAQDLDALKAKVEAERKLKEEKNRQIPPCRVDAWLKERAEKESAHSERVIFIANVMKNVESETQRHMLRDRRLIQPAAGLRNNHILSRSASASERPIYHLPPGWPPLCELPPSLHPPTPADWSESEDLEWG